MLLRIIKAQRKLSLITIILVLSLFLASATPNENTKYEWFAKHNHDNLQPLIDKRLSFIEDMGAVYLDRSCTDGGEKRRVYITFDCGYENGNIERILDVLKEKGVKATFFILGHLIRTDAELVRRMADEGHIVANHTKNHREMTELEHDEYCLEVTALERVYREATGRELDKFYRPPRGEFTMENLEWVGELGYKTVFWSFAYPDWDNGHQMSRERAIKKIKDNLHNGAIILLHPTSRTNADILGEVIDYIQAEGYNICTVDQIFYNR